MACSFTKMIYSDGDYIIRQGEIGEMFYVLYSGQVRQLPFCAPIQ